MAIDLTFAPAQIRKIRTSLELCQQRFADLLGVDQSTVSCWENGKRNPSGSAMLLLQTLEREAAEKKSKKNRRKGR